MLLEISHISGAGISNSEIRSEQLWGYENTWKTYKIL